MKINANGAMGEAGAGGDLGARHAFHEAKDERLAVSVGERPDGVKHCMRFGAGMRGMTRGRSDKFRLRGYGFFIELIVGLGASVKVGRPVARDGGEPSGKMGNFAQTREAGQRLEEYVLHEIVDIGERNAGQKNAVNHPRVAGVKQTERGPVATLGGTNE
jgi:hypothetical protein